MWRDQRRLYRRRKELCRCKTSWPYRLERLIVRIIWDWNLAEIIWHHRWVLRWIGHSWHHHNQSKINNKLLKATKTWGSNGKIKIFMPAKDLWQRHKSERWKCWPGTSHPLKVSEMRKTTRWERRVWIPLIWMSLLITPINKNKTHIVKEEKEIYRWAIMHSNQCMRIQAFTTTIWHPSTQNNWQKTTKNWSLQPKNNKHWQNHSKL